MMLEPEYSLSQYVKVGFITHNISKEGSKVIPYLIEQINDSFYFYKGTNSRLI